METLFGILVFGFGTLVLAILGAILIRVLR
jgi:hypothetical protein